MDQRQELFDTGFGFIDTLFRKYGEFFPVCTVIQTGDTEASYLARDTEEEQPESAVVMEGLKEAVTDGFKSGDYQAAAIFFDCRITHPDTNEKTDAIAVLYESVDAPMGELHFFPYQLSDEQAPVYGEGFYEEQEKEMFI